MTRKDQLNGIREPFGDAFYFRLGRLSERFDGDEGERARVVSKMPPTTRCWMRLSGPAMRSAFSSYLALPLRGFKF